MSSVFDKSKATLINLSCRHNLPPTKKRSSDFFTNKMSPPTKKDRKNEKPTTDIKTSRDAFNPGSEVLDEGEGKKQKDDSIINDLYPPAELTTNKPTRTSAYGMGLNPPTFQITGQPVMGKDRTKHCKENKNKQRMTQATQAKTSYWETHGEKFQLTENSQEQPAYRNNMCPKGLALDHPAAATLNEYATYGCLAKTGKPWTKAEIWEAVEQGPHASAALEHFIKEAAKKVAMGQATIVKWDTIKDNPPLQMRVSPIAAIPHKSKPYQSILDLSFSLCLRDGATLPSVNDSTTKTAPSGAITQLGHSLQRIIHAFLEADKNDKNLIAKWSIKDGFWRLNVQVGDKWNFAYVLPQAPGEPVKTVVLSSLQMGWVESPPYFCAATETSRDIAMQYCEIKLGTLKEQKFDALVAGNATVAELPETSETQKYMRYLIEVYVDDFMALVIPKSSREVTHVGWAIMHCIHDIFPEHEDDATDPIAKNKLLKGKGQMSTSKTLLGFDFNSEDKTMWLETAKQDQLLTILHSWICTLERSAQGIPFKEFQSVLAKIRHAFTALPAGVGLLSPCNAVLQKKPDIVYLQ